MAESKRTFQGAKIERDFDERLIQPGSYRDAVNVSVGFSEDANVGSLENVKGNEILGNQNILGLSSSTNPNAVVIGSIAHPEENKIYYFVTGDKTDGIFEYNADSGTVKPIILDSSSEPIANKTTFIFSDAGVTATVSQSGVIRVTASIGAVTAITENFTANTTGSAITQYIDVSVIVPPGYANAGQTLVGQVSASQASKSAPSSVVTLPATNRTSTTATVHGELGRDDVAITGVGFYWGYNTGGTALTISELESGGSGITRNTVNISSFENSFSSDLSSLPSDKLISFAAFATNSVGTGEGSVRTFSTVEAPAYNKLPNNRIFIFPAAGPTFNQGSTYAGYGEFVKTDGDYYFVAVASKSSGLYSDYNDLTSGVTFSNTGPASLTFSNTYSNNFTKGDSSKTSATTTGVYTITAAKSGLTSGTTQIVKGSPSGTRYKSTFNLNFAKTGVGITPFVALFNSAEDEQLHWNVLPAPLASFSIGPFEQGQKGVIMVPLSTNNSINYQSLAKTARFDSASFDPTRLDVSITGKTEGTHYEYYIATEAMNLWGFPNIGPVPAVIIEADPYVLNGGSSTVTHTLNITYNY